jgi:hypothetical protein
MRRAISGLVSLVALSAFVAVGVAHAQAAAEYGAVVGNSSTAAAGAKIKVPNVKLPEPGGATAPASGKPASGAPAKAVTPDAAAAANRQYLETVAGADAAIVSLKSTPDRAQVFVDTRFVGAAPMELKLAPGHHDIMVRATGMETIRQSVELVAKTPKEISLTLKPGAAQPSLEISH